MRSQTLNQVKVLTVASLTEFGERYINYLLQALLIFLLIDHFQLSQKVSTTLVGTTLSVIYISAIVGGYIADRILTYYSAAYLGSWLMVVGCLTLSTVHNQHVLYIALALIAISTGLIKSNISSFIGRFYDIEKLSHGHRDLGFNIFYVGINSGAFFALLFASYLRDTYGFNTAFFSGVIAGCIIIANLTVGFFLLKKYLHDIKINLTAIIKTVLIIAIYCTLLYFLFRSPAIAYTSILVAVAACIAIIIRSAKGDNKKQVWLASCFFTLSILYWSLYFQTFISILLFINACVSHSLFGIPITNSQFISAESLFVLIFGGIMGKIWLRRSENNKPVRDITKFGIGFLLIIGMFLLFYLGIQLTPAHVKVPALVIIFAFLLLAISELSLSAIGLSMVTKLAPKGYVSLYMGIWLVTLGVGGKLAGLLSSLIYISSDHLALAKHNMAMGILGFIAIAVVGYLATLAIKHLTQPHQQLD